MRTREIITLVLGLAAVAGVVAIMNIKGSRGSDTPPPEVTTGGDTAPQPSRPDTRTKLRNGPAKTSRVASEYEHKPGLTIMIDEGMPDSASELSRDPEFHAYADVDASTVKGQWIPITVDYYDRKTGTIGILSTNNQIREPERGIFLLTRVPR